MFGHSYIQFFILTVNFLSKVHIKKYFIFKTISTIELKLDGPNLLTRPTKKSILFFFIREIWSERIYFNPNYRRS
jgi:hypothetical protein